MPPLDVVLDTGPLLTMNGCRGSDTGSWRRASEKAISPGTRFGVTAVAVPNWGRTGIGALGVYAPDIATSQP